MEIIPDNLKTTFETKTHRGHDVKFCVDSVSDEQYIVVSGTHSDWVHEFGKDRIDVGSGEMEFMPFQNKVL